jgi:hypothetical protein
MIPKAEHTIQKITKREKIKTHATLPLSGGKKCDKRIKNKNK